MNNIDLTKKCVKFYIDRILKYYPYITYDKFNIHESFTSTYILYDGNDINIYLPKRALKCDPSDPSDFKLNALYFMAGHEIIHHISNEFTVSNSGRLWTKPTLENHMKSLIKCCKECACDIVSYRKFYELNRMYPSSNTENYIKRMMNGFSNSFNSLKYIKYGYIHPDARMVVIKRGAKYKDVIKLIVNYYYLVMEVNKIQTNERELYDNLLHILKTDYLDIYQVLHGDSGKYAGVTSNMERYRAKQVNRIKNRGWGN